MKYLSKVFLVLAMMGSVVWGSTTVIHLGDEVDGKWTVDSDISQEFNAPKEYYTFTLDEPTYVVIKGKSEILSDIRLFDENNNYLTAFKHCNNNICTLSTGMDAGSYTMDIISNGQFGSFHLSLNNDNIIATHPITLGQTLQGALTEESGLSITDGNPKEYYTFTLDEPTNVAIILATDDGYSSRLRLYDAMQTNLIKEAYYNYDNKTHVVAELAAGSYTIDVSNYSRKFGDFNLSLKTNHIASHPIMLGQTLQGAWTEESGLSTAGGKPKEYYTFTLDEPTNVAIMLATDDSYWSRLRLYDAMQTNLIKEAYYSSYDHKEHLVIELEAGSYTIDVSTYGRLGAFSVSLSVGANQIRLNQTLNGTFTDESEISLDYPDSKEEYYAFTLSESKEVVISVLPEETDVYFIVEDANGNNIDIEKNGVYEVAHGGNVFDLDAGEYTIRVMSKENGSYSLNLRDNKPSKIHPVELNSKIHSTFTYLSEVYHKELWSLDHGYTLEYINKYSFDVVVPSEISITTSSNETLVLFNDKQEVIKKYYGKHLEIKLEPGKYVLGVIAKNDSYMTAIDRSIDLELTAKKDYSFLIPIYGLLLQ